MNKLRLLSLFSGIGAFEKALTNIGIDYELVGFSEIDKYAINSYCAIHRVDKMINLNDVSKINVESLPKDIDMITHGSPCFTGDTLVLTDKGYKEIKDIKIGDYVLDHTNKYNKVINFLNQGSKEIWEITGMGLDILETTENHKFLVRKRERIWDNKNRKYVRNFSSPQWVECKDLSKDYFLGMAINQNEKLPQWDGIECTKGNSKYIKNNLKQYFKNPKFWYLCGRFLGDGWVRTRTDRNNDLSGVIICCGKHEDKDFENKIGDLFHYTKVEDRTTYKYQFSNKELAVFLNQFGRGAKNKIVPNFVIDLPKELLKYFLDGYFDADGYVSKTKELKATSISRKLIYGIAQCGIKVYHKPCSIYKNVKSKTHVIENRVVNQNDTYNITFYNQNLEPFYEDGYIWYPIRSVKNTHNKKITYDITVENTHSFTANACIVHNCQDYSIAGKREGGDKGSGTRSSLMWYSIEIIKHCKPKYVIWENVKNVLSKKHKHNFDKYIEDLNNLGYTSYYQVLNAKDYGIPQNRERIYCISILGEHNPYEFPKEKELTIRLKDILEETVEDKYYLNKKWHFTKPNEQKHDTNEIAKIDNINYRTINTITNPNKICRCLDIMCGGQREPKIIEIAKTEDRYDQASRVYGIEGLSPSLLARDYKDAKKILEENYRIRKLTPLEYWRLMGFSDEDFYKAQSIPTSNTQLYKQAGNSIVVNVLEEIFKQLFLNN